MKNFYDRNRQDILCFGILFAVLVLHISWEGFSYNMQLDDYIHYRTYSEESNVLVYCLNGGLFASRPFAAISDFLVWGKLPQFLTSVLLCAMLAGSGVLFWRIFRKLFGTGFFFLVIFTLAPLGMEATYWHAAATRILPPLLCCAGAVTAFDRFCCGGGRRDLGIYLTLALISFCFYEQMLVLSLALSLMLTLVQLLQRNRRAAWGLLIFVPVGIYAAVTGICGAMASGLLGSRMELILPGDPAYFTDFLPQLFSQLRRAFLEGGWTILTRGFVRGLEILVRQKLWALIPLAAAVLLLWLCDRRGSVRAGCVPGWMCPVFAVLAAVAPITPFFVIDNPWFSLRNTFAAFLGLGLLADWVLRLVLKNRTAFLTAAVSTVFLVVSVSEIHDYHAVSENNYKVAQAVIAADETYDLEGTVGILGMNTSYVSDQNFLYHAHVTSAHSAGWSLEGLVRYYTGGGKLDYKPTPLATDEAYYWTAWNRYLRDVTAYDTLLLYDHASGSMEHLNLQSGEGEWLLYFDDGSFCARIWEDAWGAGFIEFADDLDDAP